MANIYRTLNSASATDFISSIKSILSEKFGNDFILHYESTSDIVFSCSAISDKVIRFTPSSSDFYARYGNTHSSGTTISDAIVFFRSGSKPNNIQAVIGDRFLLITADYNNYLYLMIIAKTETGKSIIFGGNSSTTSTYVTSCISRDVTNNRDISFVGFSEAFSCDTGVPYKMTLLISYNGGTGDTLFRKSDGSFDTIKDLYMSSFLSTSATAILTKNALFTPRKLYTNGDTTRATIITSIVAEF